MKVFIPHYSPVPEERMLKEKTTMEKPEYRHGSRAYDVQAQLYRERLASLQTIPMPDMTPEFGKRGEVVEGVDFRIGYQQEHQTHPDEPEYWIDISQQDYENNKEHLNCRIIAVELKPEQERGTTIDIDGNEEAFLRRCLDLYRRTSGNVTVTPTAPSPTQSVEQPVGDQGVTISKGEFEFFQKVISDRINHFSNSHHKYEAKELHDALNVILRLVPPSNFTASPSAPQPVEQPSETVPDEILKDLSDFFKYSAYRGGFTISKFGGSFIIKFSDGAKAKYSIEMYKGSESTLDDQPKTTQPVEQPVGERLNDVDWNLQRIYDWFSDENRKPAITAFTSGWLRNVAREIEYRLSKPTATASGQSVEERAREYVKKIKENLSGWEDTDTMMGIALKNADKALNALAGHSSQQQTDAIEFAEWTQNQQFRMYNGKWKSTKIHFSPDEYTSTELYSLFKQRGKE